MAEIGGSGGVQALGHFEYSWETLGNGDTGKPVSSALFADRSVQVLGTFGTGGTIVIEGSNDGGTTWATLNDPQGDPISFTAAGLVAVLEYTELIRPSVTGGDGDTDLDCHLVGRKPV